MLSIRRCSGHPGVDPPGTYRLPMAQSTPSATASSSVEIMAELPRNPTGKLLKKDLRKPYWENRDRAI